MPQSLALVLVHIIFSTKNRMALPQSPDLRSEVHAYLIATLRALECEPLRVGLRGSKSCAPSGRVASTGGFPGLKHPG
jgi:hypothetical protein